MEQTPPELKIGQTILAGKYEVIKKLGNGSYGDVYEVENIRTNQKYAAKLEHFSNDQLENEGRILK